MRVLMKIYAILKHKPIIAMNITLKPKWSLKGVSEKITVLIALTNAMKRLKKTIIFRLIFFVYIAKS